MTAIKVIPARRDDLQEGIVARTGIDEAMIRRLVETFYGRIREDRLLGPIFEQRVADWPAHLARMCDFWSSVALMSGRYHGQPMAAHVRLPVTAQHFAHWLGLFEAVAREVCPVEAAEHFIERARRIATSLSMGVAFHRGNLPLPSRRVAAPAEGVQS